jgi:hypothetical protein
MRRILRLDFLKRMTISQAFLFIFVAGIVAGFVWFKVGPLLAGGLELSGDEWSTLSSFTSTVAFAFALGTGIIALIQFRQAVDSRNLEIYRDIYLKLMDADQIAARREIYMRLAEIEDRQELVAAVLDDDELRGHVKQVLNLFDYFGFIVQQDWVTEDEIIGWLSPVVVKVWAKIEPVVEHECVRRPEEPDYYSAAIDLAEKCQRWRDRRLPDRRHKIAYRADRL